MTRPPGNRMHPLTILLPTHCKLTYCLHFSGDKAPRQITAGWNHSATQLPTPCILPQFARWQGSEKCLCRMHPLRHTTTRTLYINVLPIFFRWQGSHTDISRMWPLSIFQVTRLPYRYQQDVTTQYFSGDKAPIHISAGCDHSVFFRWQGSHTDISRMWPLSIFQVTRLPYRYQRGLTTQLHYYQYCILPVFPRWQAPLGAGCIHFTILFYSIL